MSKIIVDITFNGKPLIVEKLSEEHYQVKYNDKITHPELKADDVMRALGFYMNNGTTKKKATS